MCVYCMCVLTVKHVRFDILCSQLKGISEVLWGIQIISAVTFGICVKKGEHKSRGLWDMAMFTFSVHTQTSSSALVALSNTGYANSLSHTHSQISLVFVPLLKN